MTEPQHDDVPGTVVHHTPAASGRYNGCPSIVVLPSGDLLASHSYFGPNSAQRNSFIYSSSDGGAKWERVAALEGQIWSTLFRHRGELYIFGTDQCDRVGDRLGGAVVIRRSADGGRTWTEPSAPGCGLLTDKPGYHTAPVPVVCHRGRIWKAFEYAAVESRTGWQTLALSAPADADLLDRASWTFSEPIDSWPSWQWIEGNVVAAPDGELVILSRANDLANKTEWPAGKRWRDGGEETAAMLHVSPDGRRLSHDPDRDRIAFPGGGTKFTIRFDPETATYFALVNPQAGTVLWRNKLSLSISSDLKRWSVLRDVLYHPDTDFHAFQYVDWDFDGDDIVFLSRTAHEDGLGGAHNAHDANYITFHRVNKFKKATTNGEPVVKTDFRKIN